MRARSITLCSIDAAIISTIYSSTLAYIVDANTGRSSSAVSTNSCVRGLSGFIAAEIAVPLEVSALDPLVSEAKLNSSLSCIELPRRWRPLLALGRPHPHSGATDCSGLVERKSMARTRQRVAAIPWLPSTSVRQAKSTSSVDDDK